MYLKLFVAWIYSVDFCETLDLKYLKYLKTNTKIYNDNLEYLEIDSYSRVFIQEYLSYMHSSKIKCTTLKSSDPIMSQRKYISEPGTYLIYEKVNSEHKYLRYGFETNYMRYFSIDISSVSKIEINNNFYKNKIEERIPSIYNYLTILLPKYTKHLHLRGKNIVISNKKSDFYIEKLIIESNTFKSYGKICAGQIYLNTNTTLLKSQLDYYFETNLFVCEDLFSFFEIAPYYHMKTNVFTISVRKNDNISGKRNNVYSLPYLLHVEISRLVLDRYYNNYSDIHEYIKTLPKTKIDFY